MDDPHATAAGSRCVVQELVDHRQRLIDRAAAEVHLVTRVGGLCDGNAGAVDPHPLGRVDAGDLLDAHTRAERAQLHLDLAVVIRLVEGFAGGVHPAQPDARPGTDRGRVEREDAFRLTLRWELVEAGASPREVDAGLFDPR